MCFKIKSGIIHSILIGMISTVCLTAFAGKKRYSSGVADSIQIASMQLHVLADLPETSIYFYHSNQVGSTTHITDASGEVYQHLEYFPFGETFVEERSGNNSNDASPYQFSGKEKDEATGLYYYGARYYDPKDAVWLSIDPLASQFPGLSPYNYSFNNPVSYTDPDGRAPKIVATARDKAVANNLVRLMRAKGLNEMASVLASYNRKGLVTYNPGSAISYYASGVDSWTPEGNIVLGNQVSPQALKDPGSPAAVEAICLAEHEARHAERGLRLFQKGDRLLDYDDFLNTPGGAEAYITYSLNSEFNSFFYQALCMADAIIAQPVEKREPYLKQFSGLLGVDLPAGWNGSPGGNVDFTEIFRLKPDVSRQEVEGLLGRGTYPSLRKFKPRFFGGERTYPEVIREGFNNFYNGGK